MKFSLFQQFALSFQRYLYFSPTIHLQLSDALYWIFSAPLLHTHLALWHFLTNPHSLFLHLAVPSNSAPPAKSATSQFILLFMGLFKSLLNITHPSATPLGTPLCSENSPYIAALCFTSYTIPLILSEPLKTPARLQETNQPCHHYPTTHFIFAFSLKLCHQDTFYLNSVWDSGKWNVNWRPNRKMIIYTYFWKQNQLLIFFFFWVLCRRPIKSSPEWTGEGQAKEREK